MEEKRSIDDVYGDFKKDLTSLINQHSLENLSDTPDFILADYLTLCLANFDKTIFDRKKWNEPKSNLRQ